VNSLDKLTEKFLEFNSIFDSYANESDRAAAILAASYLDSYLEECIKFFLVDDPYIEKLFKGTSPLSTFSSRIDMAFALGLITEEIKKNLDYIRKIRNHFAHYPTVTSFTDSHVRNLCSNFSFLEKYEDGTTRNIADDEPEPRKKFLHIVGLCMLGLHTLTRNQQKRTIPGKS
jgi:hypothetical protein